ncbi:Bestrophin, RFP-TM, chloride channel [Thalassoglobus neptunius]|uniref:Bestrophin, RFP-TM, chloride channel n=1 Tax=Thalassoglobus neptunius TaxID=1938619 RepID=A0A5C5WXQ9_9PLAN|nr:bestrophin family ion channel [Thalassoglobus neptunius]TWT55388.1 Bestrophin, RFP-TM, chloride channel [Thalassoglobus neptunius]
MSEQSHQKWQFTFSRDVQRLIETVHTLRRIWVFILILGLYSSLAVAKEFSPFETLLDLPSDIFALFGAVLSIILVFRTNRAYDRWWEARTLWGKQVNISRNLAIKVNQFASLEPEERTGLQKSIAGFAYALKDHLRSKATLREVPGWTDASENPQHVPAWITQRIYAQLTDLLHQNRLSPDELRICDTDAHDFLNVCGGCERIRNTLIAGSYRSYAIKCLLLYLLSLPWGLVEDFGLLTIPVTMIVGYVMIGLETIADDVEEPFGTDLDDLNLEALCETIDRTTAEILDVTPVGAPAG